MKDHVFIDSDVIIDVLSLRPEFLMNSARVLTLIDQKKIIGYTSSLCVVNCNFVLERAKIQDRADKIIMLRNLLTILPCTVKDIDDSILSKFTDFEDGVQHAIAVNSTKCKTIITRNIKDYNASKLNVMTPEQYIKSMKKIQ